MKSTIQQHIGILSAVIILLIVSLFSIYAIKKNHQDIQNYIPTNAALTPTIVEKVETNEVVEKKQKYLLSHSGNEIASLVSSSLFYKKGDWILYKEEGNSEKRICNRLIAYNTKTLVKKEIYSEIANDADQDFACEPYMQGVFVIDEKIYLLTTTSSFWTPKKTTYEIIISNDDVAINQIGDFIKTHSETFGLEKYNNKYYTEFGNGDDCISFYSLSEINFTTNTTREIGAGGEDCGRYQRILGFYNDSLINAKGTEFLSGDYGGVTTESKIEQLYFSSIASSSATTTILTKDELLKMSDVYGQVIYDPGRAGLIFYNKEKKEAVAYNLKTKMFGPTIPYPLTYKVGNNSEKIEIKSSIMSNIIEKELGNNHSIKIIEE